MAVLEREYLSKILLYWSVDVAFDSGFVQRAACGDVQTFGMSLEECKPCWIEEGLWYLSEHLVRYGVLRATGPHVMYRMSILHSNRSGFFFRFSLHMTKRNECWILWVCRIMESELSHPLSLVSFKWVSMVMGEEQKLLSSFLIFPLRCCDNLVKRLSYNAY